ncbi:MAG: diaminopimelate decarboxylase [Cyanobacteriota bacterium]
MQKSPNQNIYPITMNVNSRAHLEIGGCSAIELSSKFGTPLYIIDEDTLRKTIQDYKLQFSSKYEDSLVLYAAKSFVCESICHILHEEGIGIDVVSGGELYLALKAGIPSSKIYFNGNNKSKEEIVLAIDNEIGAIIVDNFYELQILNKIATSKSKSCPIMLRITPGIECHTHEYIKTGQIDSKFGFDLTQIEEAVRQITSKYKKLDLQGLHAHIGSQIFELDSYADLVSILLEQYAKIKNDYGLELTKINVGGGLGIKYTEEDQPPHISQVASIISRSINENASKLSLEKPMLLLEPGRSIIGPSGVTLYEIGSIKEVPGIRKYVSVDGGMADNPRPAMYQSVYTACVANKMLEKNKEVVTVAGRFCESGDILIKDIELAKTVSGDILAVFATGAYNYSMSSNYNMVPRPACVIVKDGNADIIIERESYQDLIAHDKVPSRLLKYKNMPVV